MAAVTLYHDSGGSGVGPLVAGVHGTMSTRAPGANGTQTGLGWTLGTTAAGNSSPLDAQSKNATFTADVAGVPVHPDGGINTGLDVGDCWRSAVPMNGTFATGTWTFTLSCLKGGSGVGAAGRAIFRLFKSSSETGASATEVGTGQYVGGTVTLSTITQTDSTYSGSIGTFDVTNEYLFVQIGWSITTANTGMSASTGTCLLRVGTTASQIVTSDFTQLTTQTEYLECTSVTNVDGGFGAADIPWDAPGNGGYAGGENARYLSTLYAVSETSDYLDAETPGFALVTGSTITKVKAQVLRRSDQASSIHEGYVYLVIGGSASGADKSTAAVWSTTWELITYEWTTSLPTVSEVNATNFGFRMTAVNDLGNAETASVDQMRMLIEFTPPAASTTKLLSLLGVGT